ncbi:MAG: hypothetical protein ACRED5_21110 [Propylenella sp.]
MPDYSHLSGWTPIGFHAGDEPRLEWGDLRNLRFGGPFFEDTLNEWRSVSAATETTPLAALDQLDSAPSLDPSLIIAHASRSGSTLLTQLIGALDGTVVISEPRLPHVLLRYATAQPSGFAAAAVLRKAVRALGRIRFGDERRFVLKLSSPTTRFLADFRRAFPDTPMIWLQRQPADIVASWLRKPTPGFGEGLSTDGLSRAILRRLTLVFLAARAQVSDEMFLLDYRELPDAAWTRVAPFLGVDLTPAELARMQDLARCDAKTGEPFVPSGHDDLPEWIADAVRETLDPLYEALRGRHRPF